MGEPSTGAPRTVAPLLCALALGCAGANPPPAASPPPPRPVPVRRAAEDPRRFLPQDTTAVLRVDVAAARRSPRYGALATWFRQLQPIGREAEVHLLGVLERTDTLYLTVDAYRDHTQFRCAILTGDYFEGQVEEATRRLIDPMVEATSFREPRAGFSTIVFGANVLVGVDDDRTWVFCPSRSIDAVLRRAAPPPLWTDPTFVELAENIGFEGGTVRLVGVGAPGTRDLERDLRRFADGVAPHVRGYGAAFDLEGGTTLRLSVFTDDATTARAIATRAQRALHDAQGIPFAATASLGSLWSAARVSATPGEARLELSLDPDTTDSLMARLGGLVLLSVEAAGVDE